MSSKKRIISLIKEAEENGTESSKIEFKDARSGFTRSLWRPISAFSNSPGSGVILFGISEDNKTRKPKIVGGLNLASLQEKTLSYIKEKMVNPGKYNLEIIEYKNFKLLALEILEAPKEKKPCYFKDLGLPRGACIREANTNRQITDEELRSFLRYSPAYKHDRTLIETENLNILSDKKIDNFLKMSAKRIGRIFPASSPRMKVLKNLGIIEESENKSFPTLAGILIFSKRPLQEVKNFSRYIIRCVKYAGKTPSSPIIDKLDTQGTIDQQVDDAQKFILRNIPIQAEIVGTRRIEEYEFPEDAIREIVVNSIVHRDYSITETYVHIAVFADRIEISNPGVLPPGVTIENLKESQFSRNEVIANIMRAMDYMEEFGRGIDLVYARMSERGLMEPLFKNRSNMFKVTLLGKTYKNLNMRQVKIWEYLQDNKKITATIAVSIFPEVSRATINSDLKTMVDLGLIRAVGFSTNTCYEPIY